jgi:hypothetical protein
VRAAKGCAKVVLRADVADRRRDGDPPRLTLLLGLGLFSVGRTIQDVHVIEPGPFRRRFEGAIPATEHRDETLPEEARASDHHSRSSAVRKVGAVFVLRFVHGTSSVEPRGETLKCSWLRNEQYRIVFAFRDGDAHDVRVLDYH